jgi:hypothetical protein
MDPSKIPGSRPRSASVRVFEAFITSKWILPTKLLRPWLNRLQAAVDPNEVRQLSDQIERVVFHQQFSKFR